MTDKAWKTFEREVAKSLGGRRLYFGAQDGDVEHDRFFIECKYRAKLSVYPIYEKAKEQAPKNKMPLVVLKQRGKHGALALLSLEHFRQLVRGRTE